MELDIIAAALILTPALFLSWRVMRGWAIRTRIEAFRSNRRPRWVGIARLISKEAL